MTKFWFLGVNTADDIAEARPEEMRLVCVVKMTVDFNKRNSTCLVAVIGASSLTAHSRAWYASGVMATPCGALNCALVPAPLAEP